MEEVGGGPLGMFWSREVTTGVEAAGWVVEMSGVGN